MTEKPHLVLDWHFDIPNQELKVTISEDLSYVAINGGLDGFDKTYQGTTTHVTLKEWEAWEKHWISENYGEIVGYFQPDYSRQIQHPTDDRTDDAPMGVGPDGFYLDHMQRRQCVLDGHDQAVIGFGTSGSIYTTVDNGRTIFKRHAHRNVLHDELFDPDMSGRTWIEDSMPCLKQPWSQGVKISSYDAMIEDGISSEDVERCQRHEWPDAPRPELQKLYTYPKV